MKQQLVDKFQQIYGDGAEGQDSDDRHISGSAGTDEDR